MDELLDTTTIAHKGTAFEIRIYADLDTKPTDYDCYGPDDITAWNNDEWRFIHVQTVPVIDDTPIDEAADMISGVEYGTSPEFTVTTEDIARRAVTEGWCDESVKRLAGVITERERIHRLITTQVANYYDSGPMVWMCDAGSVKTVAFTGEEAHRLALIELAAATEDDPAARAALCELSTAALRTRTGDPAVILTLCRTSAAE